MKTLTKAFGFPVKDIVVERAETDREYDQRRREEWQGNAKRRVCPVCEDAACETKSEECGK